MSNNFDNMHNFSNKLTDNTSLLATKLEHAAKYISTLENRLIDSERENRNLKKELIELRKKEKSGI